MGKTDKYTKEIVVEDPNYFNVKIASSDGFEKIKSVEICSRKKKDKSHDLIKKARELYENISNR